MPNIEERIGQSLAEAGITLSTAESCTGGMIASRLTDVPGSSAYFLGGVITYSNKSKQSILHVPEELIIQHGAVSGEVVTKMAEGVQKLFGSDLAISISGILGPTGGSIQKPVGTIWIGLRIFSSSFFKNILVNGSRSQNKRQSVQAALDFLLENIPLGGIHEKNKF